MTIVDFLDESPDERILFLLEHGKFLGLRHENEYLVKLFLLNDVFVEAFFNAENKLKHSVILGSDTNLDLYINNMLEEKKKLMDYFNQTFSYLKGSQHLEPYSALYLPKEDMGFLSGKRIPFPTERLKEYKPRIVGESQQTLNIYFHLTDIFDIGKVGSTGEMYLPEHPRKYERYGDTFMTINCESSLNDFKSCELHKWLVTRDHECPELIWSSESILPG